MTRFANIREMADLWLDTSSLGHWEKISDELTEEKFEGMLIWKDGKNAYIVLDEYQIKFCI